LFWRMKIVHRTRAMPSYVRAGIRKCARIRALSIHFKLMLTGRLLLLARDRSGWYSNCTHDVLSIDWLVFIDVGNEY
jgi:hypothetical protein